MKIKIIKTEKTNTIIVVQTQHLYEFTSFK
jgi:hypothetical protein